MPSIDTRWAKTHIAWECKNAILQVCLRGHSCYHFDRLCQDIQLIQDASACRERRISCPCSTCLSVSPDNSVVRIVQVNIGYSTVVVSLKMMDTILSVLVCEPNYIVATGESGRLHSWIMNPKWRYIG